jgi:transposase
VRWRTARPCPHAVRRHVRRRGRLSIPPEHLLEASLPMALYSVRSERSFCEQLGYNLLFR